MATEPFSVVFFAGGLGISIRRRMGSLPFPGKREERERGGDLLRGEEMVDNWEKDRVGSEINVSWVGIGEEEKEELGDDGAEYSGQSPIIHRRCFLSRTGESRFCQNLFFLG